jgi:enoyl-CoA hydratase
MSSDQDRLVKWECEEGVATLIISNGPLNLISSSVLAEFSSCVDEIQADSSVRVIVVAGAGDRAFMAGGDIKEFPQMMQQRNSKLPSQDAFEKFSALAQPTIAAVNGLAYGGGTELALLCDLRVASENAKFCLPEVSIGLFPAGGGTQRLPRLIGKPKAKEMMFLGEPISAQAALQMGLVNRVVPVGQALKAAEDLARQLASKSSVVLRLIKRAVDEGYDMDLHAGLALEAKLFAEVFETADAQEGIHAFLEKRLPRFRHY